MGKVYLDYSEGVPRLGCADCGTCSSVMGTSLCSIKDRGCCSYFPEFNLAEIHRLVKLRGGREVLDTILKNPGTEVCNYSIHAKGVLEQQAYEEYLKKGDLIETPIQDHTIFFRTCPFVVPGKGCLFEPQHRTTVCNFFICSEILERPDCKEQFRLYIEERTRYSRWIYRESQELQHIMAENGLNLRSDLNGCLELLNELPLSVYEFPELLPVEY
jgi:hypothetical protein